MARTSKSYKNIRKLIDPIVKEYFKTYYEYCRYFSDWDFDELGENVIINYFYLDDQDEWDCDSISISIDKIIFE